MTDTRDAMPAQKRVNEWALNQACRKQGVPINPAWRLVTGQGRLPGDQPAQAGTPPAQDATVSWAPTLGSSGYGGSSGTSSSSNWTAAYQPGGLGGAGASPLDTQG